MSEIRGLQPHLRLAGTLSANAARSGAAAPRTTRGAASPGATFAPAVETTTTYTRAVRKAARRHAAGSFGEALVPMVRAAAPDLPRQVAERIAGDLQNDPRLASVLQQAQREFERSKLTVT